MSGESTRKQVCKRDMEIVGVARNAHYGNLKDDFLPVVYLPFNQGYPLPNEMTFALRVTGDPLALVNSSAMPFVKPIRIFPFQRCEHRKPRSERT